MQDDKNAIFQMRFPQKLWYLLNMHTEAILWGGTGRTILLNYRILHYYLQCDHSIFKTTNISSFVRQLNLYGFRKVTSHLQDPLCNSSNPYMHEYVHDYFQYGRPEMLNKITRKALAIRKTYKTKGNADQMLFLTPLQKARRAFHEALKKATQDLFMQSSSKQLCNLESEDGQEDYCEDEETIEFDWFGTNNSNKHPDQPLPQTANEDSSQEYTANTMVNNESYENPAQETMMNFNDEPCQQSQENDNFPIQFLSMPELDAEPPETKPGVELLAEFDIDHDVDEGIVRKAAGKQNEHISLNCVLPSISNDPNDDVATNERMNDDSDHYHGEWDQMFNDFMTNKEPNQECGSDLKELYSQISRTIDLLNS
ncbi:uncharacterized protein LOC128670689 isoform X2 [Plodia interpunctella]|uniref:uncharacterized protein LOC128670689 isoform X2 n=1 Tax=Plodia interpunctella TaxID=58824 RepID=UPI002368DCB8|nr:uncharacterized protein LOC128670689 isoform X2 [Plodia interpunctella]